MARYVLKELKAEAGTGRIDEEVDGEIVAVVASHRYGTNGPCFYLTCLVKVAD